MTCPGGIDEGEKQRLSKLNLIFSPPHDATCSICGRIVAAYLIGSEWALRQHDAPLRRPSKGKGAKQPTGKVVARGTAFSSYLKTRKVRAKRIVRKGTRRMIAKGISYFKALDPGRKRMARKAIRRKR